MKGFIEIDGIEIRVESIVAIEPINNSSRFKSTLHFGMTDGFCVTKTVDEVKKLMCGGN